MLSRWVSPFDEAASMLRLLNLLEWQNPDVPILLCGPLYKAVPAFEINLLPHPVLTQWHPPNPDSPLQRCVAWRIGMYCELIKRSGTLEEYFPLSNRRDVLSCLHVCLDSMYPLLSALESDPSLTMSAIYQRRIEPESQRHIIVDYSCTSILSQLMPYVFEATSYIPEIVYDTFQCSPGNASLDLLISLLRQLTVERDRLRNFPSVVFNILRHSSTDDWLSNLVVTVIKYALLGNYPGAKAFVSFQHRRSVYNMTNENVLQFLNIYSGQKTQSREAELCVTSVLLSTMLVGVFSPASADFMPLDHLVRGWPAISRLNERVMALLINYFPEPVHANLITDIARFNRPLTRRYRNIFYAIAARSRDTLVVDTHRWNAHVSVLQSLEQVYPLVPILTADPDPDTLKLYKKIQANFDRDGDLKALSTLSTIQRTTLESLSSYYVDRKILYLTEGTQDLYFEQSARLLKLTGNIAIERTTVLYCQSCSTVRFRPVGVHLPSSHITLLVDLNFGHLHCVDCDSTNIVRINLLGKFLRCYLTVKRRRTVVTLTLCSACLHVAVCGFSAHKHGVICMECRHAVTLAAVPSNLRHCVVCGSMTPKTTSGASFWSVLNSDNRMETHTWCDRCIPYTFSTFRKNLTKVPTFHRDTIMSISNPPHIYRPGTRHY